MMKRHIKGVTLKGRGHRSSYARHHKREYDYSGMYQDLQRDHPDSALARHLRGRGKEG